jgi:6-phosphogluconolactonase
MKFMILKIFSVLLYFLVTPSLVAQELLYVSSGDALEVKKINPKTGLILDFQRIELKDISVFTFSRNKIFLYAKASIHGNRENPSIATFKVAADGKLALIYNAPISGRITDLKIDHTDNYLAGSHYGKGTASIWKLDNGVYKGELVQEILLEKNAHAARFSPDNKVLFIPATGPNKIFQLAFDQKTGKVTRTNPALGPQTGATQPRHLVFHPTLNVAYSTQERKKPGVAVWNWNPSQGALELAETLTSSEDFSGRISTADLHISPDGKFLYISSRDKQKELDRIIAYKINATNGRLTLANKFPCEHIPRSFCLNKTGDFAYVAGQKENKLGIYKINKTTGDLIKVMQYETGKNPIWVETLLLN